MEMVLSTEDNLSDEEIMIEGCRKTLHANRTKRLQKENDNNE